MKKSLIALAALAAAGVASAQTATAQNPGASAVTIFGVVDVSATRVSVDGGPSRTSLEGTGRNASSRLGFRGMEDLGGGLAAAFWLEAGINPDTGSGQSSSANNTALGTGASVAGGNVGAVALGGAQGLTFNRASTVSLLGRGFGEVRLGRDYTPTFWNMTMFDPFGAVGVGAMTNVSLGGVATPFGTTDPSVRTSNSIGWLSPNWGGFRAQAQYALSEQASNCVAATATCFGQNGDGRSVGVRLAYANGPIAAAVAFNRTTYGTLVGRPAGFGDYNLWNLAGSYNFGVARLMATYGQHSHESNVVGTADRDSKYYTIGAVAPMGPWQLKASYGHAKLDGSNAKQNQFALGAQYDLSKRTALYGTYSRLKSEGAVTAGFSGAQRALLAGQSASATGFDIGVRHSF